MDRQVAQVERAFGSWPSKISAELITRAAPSLSGLQSYGDTLYWVENRPWEAGRSVIMCRRANGDIFDILPTPYSHNSRVHVYGGTAYVVTEKELYFVNATDQRIYQISFKKNSKPKPITPSGPWRFADLIIDHDQKSIIAVCEQHDADAKPKNYLARIALDEPISEIKCLVSGADFYAYPRLSDDGTKLCWIQWDHPYMPWDNTQLWVADINQDAISNKKNVAGKNLDESIFQPQWSPNNQLYYVSDLNNWWNIYRVIDDKREIILKSEKEFASPLWQLGMSTYCFLSQEKIGCIWTEQGDWYPGIIDVNRQVLFAIDTHYSSMTSVCLHQGALCMIAGAPLVPSEIVAITPKQNATILYSPASIPLDKEDLSQPESIFFNSGNAQEVHAFYYPPHNTNYCGMEDELPPAIAMCHGGPTSATSSGLNLKIQFWTSRGFAVVDINYRGSTGFGRKFRQQLDKAWGIADVEDTGHAMAYLSEQHMVDPERCIIRGGSAGGFTVLSALTFADTFKAGASLYGIGDLETLANDTHKFESMYLESLVGPYPQCKDIYKARSPIHHAEGLNCPIIFFQGLQDKVVPPNQAKMMVNILQSKSIKVSHVTFHDEGHGFRKADNIIHAFESELSFYRDIFNLEIGT
jgi:dipeptidyl aminopeptidase/acylaminoacyl peptidase